jgi:hypothetical protein
MAPPKRGSKGSQRGQLMVLSYFFSLTVCEVADLSRRAHPQPFGDPFSGYHLFPPPPRGATGPVLVPMVRRGARGAFADQGCQWAGRATPHLPRRFPGTIHPVHSVILSKRISWFNSPFFPSVPPWLISLIAKPRFGHCVLCGWSSRPPFPPCSPSCPPWL